MVPVIHPSRHVGRVEPMLPQYVGGVLAPGSAPAHHHIPRIFVELSQPSLDVSEWHVEGAGDVAHAALHAAADVDDFEVGVVLVLGDESEGLFGSDVGGVC